MSNNNNNDGVDTYEGALDALLRSPLHQARTKEALEKAAARRTSTIADMKTYLRRLSLHDDFPVAKIVHVTGTKGKGSTCCLCESILRRHYGCKTGLFTSPHLVDVRERIRIDGQPISKAVFAQVYWQVRKRLETNATIEATDAELPVLPGYFRMLTLMALFAFAHYEPKLDVIVLEVGMGGRYDATNLFDMVEGRKIVCGVTLLDLDHTRVLGDTLEKIAWEKGGIFKAVKGQPPALGAQQSSMNHQKDSSFFAIDTNKPSVLFVLAKCAHEEGNGRKLTLVGNCTKAVPKDLTIGLPGSHQRINAELAVALCRALFPTTANKSKETLHGALAQATWPGRCQTVPLPDYSIPTHLRLDGSHTPISLRAGHEWFSSVSQGSQTKRILVFNCSHERNPVELLQILHDGVVFEKAYFCRADFERPSAVTKKNADALLGDAKVPILSELLPNSGKAVTWQMTLASIWKHLEAADPNGSFETMANLTVGEALEGISKETATDDGIEKVEIFVVGSLYIVGSALDAVGWSESEAAGKLRC